MQHAALGVVDEDVIDVGFAQRRARQGTDRVEVEIIQGIGEGVGQLAHFRLAVDPHLLRQQSVHGRAGHLADLHLGDLLAVPQQHHHHHHRRKQQQDRDEELRLQAQPRLHSTSARIRARPTPS